MRTNTVNTRIAGSDSGAIEALIALELLNHLYYTLENWKGAISLSAIRFFFTPPDPFCSPINNTNTGKHQHMILDFNTPHRMHVNSLATHFRRVIFKHVDKCHYLNKPMNHKQYPGSRPAALLGSFHVTGNGPQNPKKATGFTPGGLRDGTTRNGAGAHDLPEIVLSIDFLHGKKE